MDTNEDLGPAEGPTEDFDRAAKKSTPAVPLNAGRFTKYHLLIDQGEYDQIYRPIMIQRCSNPTASFRMMEVLDATSDDFLYNLQRVGHLYGWDRRKKYQPENKGYIDELMGRDSTRMFIFQVDGEDAGFCVVTNVANPEQQTQGAKKEDILESYKRSHRLPARSQAVEIYKIGLYDEYTGKGFGNFLLAKVLHQLFTKAGNDIVYLDTRDTNHAGVLKFYQQNGINVHLQEDLISDLVEGPTHEWHASEDQDEKIVEVPNGDSIPGPDVANDNDRGETGPTAAPDLN